ncbi:alpha/beta hydrolase [Vicingaceae bacterium]|nr:alpha/beta hydrolase [Vicingaceae bacterium]MDB4060920.1 alpha/beta hydrolase [Vicingaceae bacterium]MDB9963796.1 alpha/beta hydrolase [Vicingaceae bacterium]MDC1450861.1 alpha/beta hydrolase [Vicingaceae bacterium]
MLSTFVFRSATIAYSVKGKGRAILLIHGLLGAKEVWKELECRLAKNFKVVSIDLPGHGQSECIGYVHGMELLAECCKSLLTHLSIRKAIVVGHSLGGYVSLAFGEKFPDSVLGLMLVNSTAKGDSEGRKKSRNQLIRMVKKDRLKLLASLVPSFFNIKSRTTTWQIKSYLKMALNCSEQSIIAAAEGMKNRKEREIVLKFAPYPYHYIIGVHDSILDCNQLIKESKIGMHGSYSLLEDVSHMSLVEGKEEVFRAIKSFSKR